jgi:hypothetical protein
MLKITSSARYQWLTPAILATQEAEIRRIKVRTQPWQIVHETLSQNFLDKLSFIKIRTSARHETL